MVIFHIGDAQAQLSKLLRRVRAGQDVIIVDTGIPVAKLVSIDPPRRKRRLGEDRGKIWAAPDAFEPLAGDDRAPRRRDRAGVTARR